MDFKPGDEIRVLNAFGDVLPMVAVTAAEPGRDFPVVWVCSPDEYQRAQGADEEPEAIPWPLSAVRIAELA